MSRQYNGAICSVDGVRLPMPAKANRFLDTCQHSNEG
jgi:hypothetical protein